MSSNAKFVQLFPYGSLIFCEFFWLKLGKCAKFEGSVKIFYDIEIFQFFDMLLSNKF